MSAEYNNWTWNDGDDYDGDDLLNIWLKKNVSAELKKAKFAINSNGNNKTAPHQHWIFRYLKSKNVRELYL